MCCLPPSGSIKHAIISVLIWQPQGLWVENEGGKSSGLLGELEAGTSCTVLGKISEELANTSRMPSILYELGGRVAEITNDSHLPLSISGVEPYMRVTCTNQVPSSALPTFCCSSLHCSRVRRHICGLPASTPGQPSVKCSALKPPDPGTISARALFAADSARRGMTIHSAIGFELRVVRILCRHNLSTRIDTMQRHWFCNGRSNRLAVSTLGHRNLHQLSQDKQNG